MSRELYLDMLKDELLKLIPVIEFHNQHDYPDWSGDERELVPCPMPSRHEGGDDSTSSLAINPDTGSFFCHGCGMKGTSVIGYYTDVHCDGNFKQALVKMHTRYVSPIITKEEIHEHRIELHQRKATRSRITQMRGWLPKTMADLKIGWSEQRKRTVIPIFNLAGFCLDTRYHDTIRKAKLSTQGKRIALTARKGGRNGDWFPFNPRYNPFDTSKNEVWIVEGEPDAVMAYQEGLNVVTLTGGAKVWSIVDHERLKPLKGKDIVLCLDNDKAGQDAAEIAAKRLVAMEISSLKNVVVPEGNDFTDWILKYGGSGVQIRQIAQATDFIVRPRKSNVQTIPLADASIADNVGKYIKTDVLINGMHSSPQVIPRRMTYSCTSAERCSGCPCRDSGAEEYHVHPGDRDILEWLYARDYGKMIRKEMGLSSSCRMRVQVEEHQNLQSMTCIPALTDKSSEDKNAYIKQQAFFLGHGLEGNQSYRITAQPTTHPRTKESVLLVEKAVSSNDSIKGFALSKERIEELRSIFSDDPKKIVKDVAEMQSLNHTHIYKRWDLHVAVDLCYHSPRDFSFGGTALPKGSIEVLLFGDTRCGKGQVAEGLMRFYDLGDVISGENASFMGLCGGASKVGDQFQLSWGAIPLNHGRLVIIDEFSGLSDDTLGKLSRVRSEGIAEINKGGISDKTQANARLIWIANPRKGREVGSFASGVKAIEDLVKANEDIARFDLAVVVQKGEVELDDINRVQLADMQSKYKQPDLRDVVLWVWSRKPEHVIFTREATNMILKAAANLATRYSATIPLIQGENARFKLAKIAAAIAGRCFSTPDGVFLKVTERHAELAAKLICHFYDKPSMGYRDYSAVESGGNVLERLDVLDQFFKIWPVYVRSLLVDGMLEADKFGARELMDWCGTDGITPKKHLGILIQSRAIRQTQMGLYTKKPAFIKYLKKLKRELDKR